jgi:toluene monooxygenase system protein E
MPPQKTYWHLLAQRRMPTEYELVSSRLHYYPAAGGFEIDAPLQTWYRQYQQGSPLVCRDWEQFSDPRETTYTRYTALQAGKEVFVDGLLASLESSDYDAELSEAWRHVLGGGLAPLRYPCHGLQMVAAYIGQMAPGGRITLAALFQAADEVRRIQRLAYRVRQLQCCYPGFGDDSRQRWQEDPLWQPLREVVEKLLIAYDWGEAFTGLNLVLKPLLDGLFMWHFGRLARQAGDYLLQQLYLSLYEDCQWHQQWSQALLYTALQDTPANRGVIQDWVQRWYPLAWRAAEAFAPLFARLPQPAPALDFAQVLDELDVSLRRCWGLAGLGDMGDIIVADRRAQAEASAQQC